MIEPLESRRYLTRESVGLNSDWSFFRGDPSGAQNPSFNDSSWTSIDLPHTYNAIDGQNGGDDYYRGAGWYRKQITAPSGWSSQQVFLQFDGASLKTDVFLDGALVGSHLGGFERFRVDLTDHLDFGQSQTLALRISNAPISDLAPQSGDYTVNGGLYRYVNLIATGSTHVEMMDHGSSGVKITTPVVGTSSSRIHVTTQLKNDNNRTRTIDLVTRITDDNGRLVKKSSKEIRMPPGATRTRTAEFAISNPHLWNGIDDPYLYNVEVRVESGGKRLDHVREKAGIRSFDISTTGFRLNGQSYDLHGVNMHQDRADKGWAVSNANIRQDLDLIRELGATMVRFAHYQHAPFAYDYADQLGLIVWTEVPVNGTTSSGDSPSTSSFRTNSQQELRELIRQNRNHPSIITWGLFNELDDNANNQTLIHSLQELAEDEDPTRPTTAASWNALVGEVDRITDTLAFNRYYGWYYGQFNDLGEWLDARRAASPTIPMGIAEYGAGASLNHHEINPSQPVDDGNYHPEEYQNILNEQSWPQLESRDWLWTKLIWVMFDFASDSRAEGDQDGINDKGLVTHDRTTKKDSFYYYKAQWSDSKVTYITSGRFKDRDDANAPVKVYSNAPRVRLLLNGQTVSTKDVVDGIVQWNDIELRPGANTVKAIGLFSSGQKIDTANWNFDAPSATGSISGFIFNDLDSDGVFDGNETKVSGWTVFIDTDNDGQLDAGERTTLSSGSGAFAFNFLPPGSFKIRIRLNSGWVQTLPLNNTGINVTLTDGQTVAGQRFGVREA